MSSDLQRSLTTCRARLAKCQERLTYAEAKYETELATADDARVATLATNLDDARRALAVEQDRERSILAAIDREDEAKCREDEAAAWDQVKTLAERRTKATATVAKFARQMGEAWAEVQETTEAMRKLLPAALRPNATRHSDDIVSAFANTLVRAGVRGIIPNDSHVLPTHPGLVDRVASSNNGVLADWGRCANG